jgi:hypothetical protein
MRSEQHLRMYRILTERGNNVIQKNAVCGHYGNVHRRECILLLGGASMHTAGLCWAPPPARVELKINQGLKRHVLRLLSTPFDRNSVAIRVESEIRVRGVCPLF